MPTWVDSTLWGAKVADCGPYIGSWPPYPPLPATFALEPDSSEIDYFVAAPNPSTDPAAVADGSYDTTYVDIWRTDAIGGSWNSQLGTSGAATPDWSSPPPGAHLFVFWYEGDGATPAHDALELAPTNMVAGGTAPSGGFPGSTWSDWQPDDPTTGFSSLDDGAAIIRGNTAQGDPNDPPSNSYTSLLADPVGKARDYLTADLAGTSIDSSNYSNADDPATAVDPNCSFELSADLSNGTFLGNHNWTEIDAHMVISCGAYGFTPPADGTPAGFDVLIPGLDYAVTVDMLLAGVYWQRDPDGTATWGWDRWTPEVLMRAFQSREGISPTLDPIDNGAAFRFAAVPDLTFPTLLDYGAGATLYLASGIGPGVDQPVLGPPGYTGVLEVLDIDISGQPADVLNIVAQPAVINDPLDPAMPTPNTPASGTDTFSKSFTVLSAQLTTWHQGTLDARPKTTYTLPNWRYLLPGVFWHNAFGHYAPAGSVPLQIYTPPHGWVDIVDGPA